MIREERIQIPFRYASGGAGSRFLSALGEGRILGARCPACARVLCPAPPFCPRCGQATSGLVEVGPRGRVVSFTELPGRGAYGLVQLDGADTPLLHRLLGSESRFAVGARVRARFAAQRTGSILDVEGFEPAEAP